MTPPRPVTSDKMYSYKPYIRILAYPSNRVARCLDIYAYQGVVEAQSSLLGTWLCGIRYADFRERLPSGRLGE